MHQVLPYIKNFANKNKWHVLIAEELQVVRYDKHEIPKTHMVHRLVGMPVASRMGGELSDIHGHQPCCNPVFAPCAPGRTRVGAAEGSPHASRTANSVRLRPSFPNDANWQSSLVTSLQTAGVRDLQAQQIGFRSLLAFVAVALLMLAPVWIEHSVLPLTTHFKVFARVGWLFATTFGFGVLIRIIIRYLRRVYAHTAEEELKRNDARRPIFYLRSFSLEV